MVKFSTGFCLEKLQNRQIKSKFINVFFYYFVLYYVFFILFFDLATKN